MGLLTHLLSSNLLQSAKQLSPSSSATWVPVRHASKKTGSRIRAAGGNPRPKHRGIRFQDGHFVTEGTTLVKQLKVGFHPGLYVGFGRDATLYAKESGRVMITCEKINPNIKHPWITFTYAGRENEVIYKKFFNVIPEPQHKRFKLIDAI